MRKGMCKRFFALFLTVSFSISLLVGFSVPASAVSYETFTAGMAAYEALKKVDGLQNDISKRIANAVDFEFRKIDVVSAETLDAEINYYNNGGWFGRFLASYPDAWETIKGFYHFMTNSAFVPRSMQIEPRPDPAQNGIYRPYVIMNGGDTGGWFVDVNGNYPYCSEEDWNVFKGYDFVSTTPQPFDGRWLTTNSIRDSKKTVQKSYADLDATKADLANKHPNSSVTISTLKIGNLECKVIRRLEDGPGNRDWVWCDPNGLPYVYIDPDTQGAVQDWNYTQIQDITNNQTEEIKQIITEQGDKIDQIIDLDNNVSIAPNVSLDPSLNLDAFLKLNIDKITIDQSDDRTIYTVDSHDVTYNVENNFYEYNYYTYNYEFTYNNTYVTYVGSTAEYQPKEWALYYELPDGRSSADLTEEDIAGLSFQFADVINYKRASTSGDLWALYHFDGSTNDDSYYAAEDSFSWDYGSSINYMESNAFNGALYLDEQPHQFHLKLPSNLGTKDFTLQWRYYQNSAVTSENADNYISAGGKELLRWSEKNMYLSGASDPCETKLSIGSWQELALVRSGGTLYLYHNGVSIANTPISGALSRELTISFGGSSRAYSMIDELRLVTRSIVTGGSSYTPTAVPYDSNSVLVLPGESTVTDSYYKWDTTRAPLWSFDVEKDLKEFQEFGTIGYSDSKFFRIERGEIYTVNSPNISSDGSLFTLTAGSEPWDFPFQTDYDVYRAHGSGAAKSTHPGFWVALTDVSVGSSSLFSGQKTMALTLVGPDLERYTILLDDVSPGKSWTGNFDWGSASVMYYSGYNDDVHRWYESCSLSIHPKPNTSFSFRYIELVPGSQPNTGHQLVTDTYSAADLQPNTAAIQTDIPIKGYTVGGVRPTFPSRGDVWFPAEGSRISGVQVYNGQAWEETNARYWTGKRWIPIYAFDLVTLADMWDVNSSTGVDVTPPITSETGFWNWWKNQWLEFQKWMEVTFGKCEHDYKEEILRAPTCTQQGAAMYTCTKCRDSYIDTLEPLGHAWVLTDSVEDTFRPGLQDVTSLCVITVPSNYSTMENLRDGDPSTLWVDDYGAYPATITVQLPRGRQLRRLEVDFEPYEDRTFSLRFQSSGWGQKFFTNFSVYDTFFVDIDRNKVVQSFEFIFDGTNEYAWPAIAEMRVFIDGDPVLDVPGYDKYVCSRCGLEYIDHDRTGPPEDLGGGDPADPNDPAGDGESSLVSLIQELFDAAGDLIGKLIGWVIDLAADAMAGFGRLGEFFAQKAEEVKGFGGEYTGFLGAFFEVIPPEIKSCISIALVFFGLLLFVRKVLM